MDDQTKFQILLATFAEKNKVLHVMRERIEKTCMWAMGVFLGAAGWIIQSKICLTSVQKGFLDLVILVAVVSIRCFFFRDIQEGFKGQQKALARIEEALQLYEPGVFDRLSTGIYPASWRVAGTENGQGKYFCYSYWLLYLSAGVLVGVILTQGWIY